MSWMQKLYETYWNISNLPHKEHLLWPLSHFVKKAHVEIVIDGKGNLLKERIRVLHGEEGSTLIPATEDSAGRSGKKIAPHPLCDELGYCAIDLPNVNKEKVAKYLVQLKEWKQSRWSHTKLDAISAYLQKERLWRDLSQQIDFPIKIESIKEGKKTTETIKDNSKVFLRWRVEEQGVPESGTWEDKSLIESWIGFDQYKNTETSFCYVLGQEARRATNHSRFIRRPGDGAKLLSSNDSSGFTFRGRFTDSKKTIDTYGAQAVGVSYDVSQKAHNALRWLISNQGNRTGDQVYVAWAVNGQKLPSPLKNSWELFADDDFELEEVTVEQEQPQQIDYSVDIGDSFAQKLKRYLSGYGKLLDVNEQIIIMGVDSATPGRMGIIYYRELLASEFLQRLDCWHTDFSWPQRYTQEIQESRRKKKTKNKTIWPISTPAPQRIAKAAYGNVLKSNETLYKSVVERILPCIVDGQPFPRDILLSAVHKCCNRNNIEWWEWQQNLGTTCALYKGYYKRNPDPQQRRNYSMSLEQDNTSRDYLFGRLLAVAEYIEEIALGAAGESRPTNAARMMQRFADQPCSAWRNLELALQPYMQRLQNSRKGFLVNRRKDLAEIMSLFQPGDFTVDRPLSGEFLLGYHCQRQYWMNTKQEEGETL